MTTRRMIIKKMPYDHHRTKKFLFEASIFFNTSIFIPSHESPDMTRDRCSKSTRLPRNSPENSGGNLWPFCSVEVAILPGGAPGPRAAALPASLDAAVPLFCTIWEFTLTMGGWWKSMGNGGSTRETGDFWLWKMLISHDWSNLKIEWFHRQIHLFQPSRTDLWPLAEGTATVFQSP